MGRNTRQARNGLIPDYCEIPGCDFSSLVTKHRIKPGRKGGKYLPMNVIGLCPNHHALAEMGEFSQYELFEIVRYRYSTNWKKEAEAEQIDSEEWLS